MNKVLIVVITALTFIWVGLVCGISFIEAPLKFQAPNITLELGLGIGKLVFGALTKIEMAIASLIGVGLLLLRTNSKQSLFFIIAIVIVIIDNAILMPVLDQRIDMITNGVVPPRSNVHWWYVVLEVLKLFSLLVAGITFLNNKLNNK